MNEDVKSGRLVGLGVGPGDPELLTLKARRLLDVCPVVAYFSASRRPSNARHIVSEFLTGTQEELHFAYPVTTELPAAGAEYEALMATFYDESSERVAEVLASGRDVAVLCEGDPFFHGSFMYLYNRLSNRFPTTTVSGVSSILAGSAVMGMPLICRDEVLIVVPATLSLGELIAHFEKADVAVVMKVGRNLAKVRRALDIVGLLPRAWYVERATMAGERVLPLEQVDAASAPYFSMVVVPSETAGTR